MASSKTKHLDIIWMHFQIDNVTSTQLGKSSAQIRFAINELKHELNNFGVIVHLTEIYIDKTRISDLNKIYLNGVLIEGLLSAAGTEDKKDEDIPLSAIKKAAYQMLGLDLC